MILDTNLNIVKTHKNKKDMKIFYNLALVVGLVVLLALLLWYLVAEDIQLCLNDTRVAVIPIPYTWVSKAGQPESEMDGFPSTIKHPPKKGET
jgi:hypothetical protein